MKLLKNLTIIPLFTLLTGFLTLLISGCGGGTSGTDGGGSFRSTISGTLEDDSGNGIAQATVLLENTDDSATTSENGSFEISALIPSEPLALTVRTQNGQGGSVELGTFTPEKPNAVVILILDQSGNIRIRSIQLSPLPTPTPLPEANPPSAATPPAQGTAAPVPTPKPKATLFFEITALEPDNVPIQGLRISIEAVSAVTNSSGIAQLTVSHRGGPVRINYLLGDFRGTTVLRGVPVEDAQIQMTVEVDVTSSQNSPVTPGCSTTGNGGGASKPGCSFKPKVKSIARKPRG